MLTFKQKTAFRIAAVSLLLAILVSPIAWLIAKESAESSVVALAISESDYTLQKYHALNENNQLDPQNTSIAASNIVGPTFDIAEIYDRLGNKLAESATPAGHHIEKDLKGHGKPLYTKTSYTSETLHDGTWTLRVFVPIHSNIDSSIVGYFEGVRVIPAWQHQQIKHAATIAMLMVCIASILCGMMLYPVVITLFKENERKAKEILESHIAMMEALGRAIAKRDSDTGIHNYRVAWISAKIGELLDIHGDRMQALIAGSFLHDVGKIGIPDSILLKPGKLDEHEFSIMRTHVEQGTHIVEGIGWLDGAKDVVSGHHEKWNGQGYPLGLHGENIPLSARIFAVADVFDALCSKRPYKEPMPFNVVMQILSDSTGTHFDPTVMAVFTPIAQSIYTQLNHIDEAQARHLLEERVRFHFNI